MMVAGCTLLVMAPVWRYGIAPLFIRLPDDVRNSSIQKGKLTVFADRATSRLYPSGQEQVTPVVIQNEDVGVPSRSDGRTLVVDERVTLRDRDDGQALEGLRKPATYVLDRRTCENVPGVIDGIDRTGFTIKFPMLSEKKAYPIWDDDLQRTVTANFVKTGSMDGFKTKGVEVYIYRINGELEKMAVPPPGVPEFITGRKAKELTGNTSLPVPDDSEIRIEYFKKNTETMYVEPKTGAVVYSPGHKFEYYVKNAPGESPAYIKIAEFEYSTDRLSAKRDIDDGEKYRRLIDLDLKWTPLSFLLWGIALIALGVFLTRRRAGDD
jgi:Porin PorA